MYRFSKSAAALGLSSLLVGVATDVGAFETFPTAVVVDGTGKVVGPLIDVYENGYPTTAVVGIQLEPGQPPIGVPFEREHYFTLGSPNSDRGAFGWATEDCTGPAYVLARVPPHTMTGYYPTQKHSQWFPDTRATPATVTLRSGYGPGGVCAKRSPFTELAVPAKLIDLHSLGFSPPFKIDLR